MTDADFKAEGDIDALTRSDEIMRDPARLAAAKNFAETRNNEFARIADSLPSKPARRFNGAVKDSKMAGKG